MSSVNPTRGEPALEAFETPCLLVDLAKLDRNIAAMHNRLRRHQVGFRPHAKTAKNANIVRRMIAGGPDAITVSSLAEAEYFFRRGMRDLLYAVGIVPAKLDRVADLRREGADITIVLDDPDVAGRVAQRGKERNCRFPVLIEIDCDGERAGIVPGNPELIAVGRALHFSQGAELRGVMTHAGGSYHGRSPGDHRAMAERERSAAVGAADGLAEAGLPCPVVSVGSTPTAFFGTSFHGVTEVRAGVFAFGDLTMTGLGVCSPADIALSVLTRVIAAQRDRHRLIVDAGWTALSRDLSTKDHAVDYRYGLVCDARGDPISDLIVTDTNQEHGIVASRAGGPLPERTFGVGDLLRILPVHACATASGHSAYRVLDPGSETIASWERCAGW